MLVKRKTERPFIKAATPDAGMWTVRYFKSKQYNWSGISQQPSMLAMAKRGLLQFTPHSWDNFDWHVFSSPKRCIQARPSVTHIPACMRS